MDSRQRNRPHLSAPLLLAVYCAVAVSSRAAVATSHVAVRVGRMDVLGFSRGSLTLRTSAPTTAPAGAAISSDRLRLVHNSTSDVKLTAECRGCVAVAPGWSLSVSVEGAAGPIALLTEGAAADAQDVLTNVVAGVIAAKTVAYTAQAEIGAGAATVPLTVAFTSLEQ